MNRISSRAAGRCRRALPCFDLLNDPNEINNLIGHNPDRQKSRAEAERMKVLTAEVVATCKGTISARYPDRSTRLQAARLGFEPLL